MVSGVTSSSLHYVAASGLRDANLRLAVAADNIANVHSENFSPSRVVSRSAGGGGVISDIETQPSPPPQRPLPGQQVSPQFLFPSQTDLITEALNVITAKSAFQANAKLFSAQRQADEALFQAFA